MISREETLRRLKENAMYEEKISKDLLYYFLESLDDIKGLTLNESEELHDKLQHILDDSIKHDMQIINLMEYVLRDGKDSF